MNVTIEKMLGLAITLLASACVLEERGVPANVEVAETMPILGSLFATPEDSSLKWNRITWNRITWNRITWNAIDWSALSDGKQRWHELRVGPLASGSLVDAASDPRMTTALTDPEVREIFGYIFECVAPEGEEVSYVDDNGAQWTFEGLHGMAPGWVSGACDLSCQRSVSACIYARVNYWGERNVMSWRRGTGIELNDHTDGLENPTLDENLSFELEEGAVWGNLFLSDPEVFVCQGQDSIANLSMPGVDMSMYGGQAPMGAIRMCDNDPDCLDDVFVGPCGGQAGAICADKRNNGGYDQCAAPGAATYTEVVTIRRADYGMHADFVAGTALRADMSSCADTVHDLQPTCDTEHEQACVDLARNSCGAHSISDVGSALSRDASTCTAYVCAVYGSCCTLLWDSACVNAAAEMCQ